MAKAPWLSIIGLGEDGPKGLAPASLLALNAANIIMGPQRHLALLEDTSAKLITWPVPFADGIEILLSLRGRGHVAVLASGDPFYYGAGSTLTQHLQEWEWRAFPALSCFSLAANRLGWALSDVTCAALHAAPFSRIRQHLAANARLIVTLRDGAAVGQFSSYICAQGFGSSQIHICQALGGPDETCMVRQADEITPEDIFAHPVCAAILVQGSGAALTQAGGLEDAWFENDGQITKRAVRALTLSTLAPRAGEHLWDIGGGSGSVSIEWLLAHPSLRATCIEPSSQRAARIAHNAQNLGVENRLTIVHGAAPAALGGLAPADAIFIGGGLSADMLEHLTEHAAGTRLVANAVTLESEALLMRAQTRFGGDLLRVDLAHAVPLGRKRGWRGGYPIVQWSTQL